MTDIQAATESIVAATSHPVSVQLINQGAGIWGNVATGLITGLLTGGYNTHWHLADTLFHA